MRSLNLALLVMLPTSALLLSARAIESPALPEQASGVPAQPPRTSPQPAQSLPQPPQSLPQPAHTTPPSPDQPAPATPTPATPAAGTPEAPQDVFIVDPADPRLTPQQREQLARMRASRPFSFQPAQSEAVFYGGVQRLMRDEQRFSTAGEEQLRRLGEIRGMSGERQTAALLDLMQQVLITNRELHQYLTRSRSTWSGEFGDREQNAPEANEPERPRNTPEGQVLPRMLR